MKFTTAFVALLAVSSAYTLSFEKRDEMDDMMNQMMDDMKKENPELYDELNKTPSNNLNQPAGGATDGAAAGAANPLGGANTAAPGNSSVPDLGNLTGMPSTTTGSSLGCTKHLDEYNEACIPKESDYDKGCDYYLSDKCQKLRETKITSKEGCANATFEQEMLDQLFVTLDMKCAKDGAGNYCPISKKVKKNTGKPKNQQEDLDEKDFKESCKSIKCREVAVSTVNLFKNATEQLSQAFSSFGKQKREFKSFEEILTYLDSKECVSQSGAQAIKIGSAALASTLAVFLYYLL